jgi:hypothetical protein
MLERLDPVFCQLHQERANTGLSTSVCGSCSCSCISSPHLYFRTFPCAWLSSILLLLLLLLLPPQASNTEFAVVPLEASYTFKPYVK